MIKTILNLNRAGINRTATRTALHFKYEPDISADIYGGGEQKKMNMCQAICSAHDVQLGRDETTIVFGEDVKFGGVFRCTVSNSNCTGDP
jgi:hypothetical protein